MKSEFCILGNICLPNFFGEIKMIPFKMDSLRGLPTQFKGMVSKILEGFHKSEGVAFFTIHGKFLRKNDTLRRGGPHTDGNYDPYFMTWGGGGGWKVGEDGPSINSELHKRQYNSKNGGIILVSNYESCLGWEGEYNGLPNVGGNCSHIDLSNEFLLSRNKIYYGNNHFIHESLPVDKDVHRVMCRITLPENHVYRAI